MITWVSTSQATLILDIDANGNLLGAKNVLVGSTLYDVGFYDGTCIALFGGCDSQSDFTFITQADALLASTALLDLVFLNVLGGDFDTDPSLTNGCSILFCRAHTVYQLDSNGFIVDSVAAENDDVSDGFWLNGIQNINADYSAFGAEVYAVWERSVNVPEPSTLAVFALGMIGLALRRFKTQS